MDVSLVLYSTRVGLCVIYIYIYISRPQDLLQERRIEDNEGRGLERDQGG